MLRVLLSLFLVFPWFAGAKVAGAQDLGETPSSLLSIYSVPSGWNYEQLEGDPAQDVFPSLQGLFEHKEIKLMLGKLHSGGEVKLSQFMDQLLQKRIDEGQRTIETERSMIKEGIFYLEKQRSLIDIPILTGVYSFKIQGQPYFLELEAHKPNFLNNKEKFKALVIRLHSE